MRYLLFVFLFSVVLMAVDYPPPQSGDFTIRDFRFQSGQTLEELRLHYVTIGTPKRDAGGAISNAVLLLHGTNGSGQSLLTSEFAGAMFGPGQLLDATRYFLILPDSIGAGLSSKPSDRLRMRFPRYGYHDMVAAQHQLLTERLGVNHLRLVMGISMGGMHTWLWGQLYPDMMDALLPVACLPAPVGGRNALTRLLAMEAIRSDPSWNDGDYVEQPRGLALAVAMRDIENASVRHLQATAPTRTAAKDFLDQRMKSRTRGGDANNMLYQLDASWDYDPSSGLNKISAPLLAINFADDEVNPVELGLLEKAIQRVRLGQHVLIPAGDHTRGHGSSSNAALWSLHVADLLKSSSKPVISQPLSER